MEILKHAISPDHPALSGHFPGNPIIPGVVLLDEVLMELKQRGIKVLEIVKIKFIAPLQPGTPFRLIFLSCQNQHQLNFFIKTATATLVSGTLQCSEAILKDSI